MLKPVAYTFSYHDEVGDVGLLMCESEVGEHVTLATTDVEYVRLIASGGGIANLSEIQLGSDKFPHRLDGKPDEWLD